MALIDLLIGNDSIQRQRRLADEAARSRFDPDQFLPQLEQAQQQAQEGIADEQIREQFLTRLFAQQDPFQQDTGADAGRFMSMMGQQQSQTQGNIGQFETKIGLEEEQAQREGEATAAEIMGRRRQMESQREAKLAENRLMAEAEADRRKKQLGTSMGRLLGLGASAIPGVGPLGAAAIGAGTGGAFGGAEGFMAGGITGAGASLNIGAEDTEEEDDTNFNPRQDAIDFTNSLDADPVDFINSMFN